MIAGEEKSILVKQHHVSAGVPGRRNHAQIAIPSEDFFSLNHTIDTESLRSVVCVHQPFAAKLFGKPGVIGHIVTMCQEHDAHATHGGDSFDKLGSEARRINQHVATLYLRSDNQITPGAEARLRSKAAEVDVIADK